jgi:glycosyltransferase involved in cell wall biosynthesis
MRFDHFVPNFAPHDAIGNHVLQLQRALRAAGHDSDIYAEAMGPTMHAHARPFSEAPTAQGERVLLYHASTHSAMPAWLAARAAAGEVVQTYYYDITPAPYFARWLPDAARDMDVARRQVAELAPAVALGMTASRYSEKELISFGYSPTATCPLIVDLSDYHQAPDARVLARLRRQRERNGARWLFVGRIAPNKCQHDILASFALYRQVFDPRAHLTLVGGATAPRYLKALHALAADLELGDSLDIVDVVAFPTLLAEFAVADVFVCLSEHEGFCVPILEAMELGVPVVAYDAAAVPETLGAGGTLLADKDPLQVACSVEAVLADDKRRAAAVEAGRAQARSFAPERTSAGLVATIEAHLDGVATGGART